MRQSQRQCVTSRRDKENEFAELLQGDRCRLVVVGIETGGRWSTEAAAARAWEAPRVRRRLAFLVWTRKDHRLSWDLFQRSKCVVFDLTKFSDVRLLIFVSKDCCHPRVMSLSLPHLTLTTSTSSLSRTTPIFPTFSLTCKSFGGRSIFTVRRSTAEWQINTHRICHEPKVIELEDLEP